MLRTARDDTAVVFRKLDAASHHKGVVRELEILTRLRRDFGPVLIDLIDRASVQAWATRRRGQVSASTVNREVDVLKVMLRDAVPEYLTASPLAGLRKLRVTPPRRTLMTKDQEARLLAVCRDPQDRALIILGVDTLQRLGTLLALQRSDRSKDGKWIYIRDSKNGEAREVPLSPDAAAALDAIPDRGPFYFSAFRRAKEPSNWRSSVRQRMELLCKRASVPFGKKVGGMTLHWMTHRTGATRLLIEKRVPISVVQSIGIWKTPTVMLEIYAGAQRSDMAAAVGQS